MVELKRGDDSTRHFSALPHRFYLLSAHLDSIFFEFRFHHVFILNDLLHRFPKEFALIPGPTVVG